MATTKLVGTERRHGKRTFNQHFARLTGEQVNKVYSLTKLGFQLDFVRTDCPPPQLAVLHRNNELVTVDPHGICDFSPALPLRHQP
ncbi:MULTISPECIES: hypothetical protein [unclassified Pseudoalteromonas]|uniref:hypothetical protein n=1 Tax=unclassified Pseudoalteromonas TaxID=194690 RepID=UPI000CF5FB25|nr:MULTISPECIES: hypothetical protein [unclassified Pseudoalteromonas]MBS3798399.1 hypothetical protein [Pseudoalteromonas sp. BDTF-M6]